MSETLLNTNQNQLNNDDASFVELIQKVQEGKAKLTQAIINKGGNVSNSSTYDQLTQAISDLQTGDGKAQYLVESFYDVYSNINSVPTDIISANFLPYHNALIGVTNTGLINIYKPNDEANNIIPVASVSTSLSFSTDSRYINFGYNKNETKFVLYDCHTDHKYLVVLFMDWSTNTLELKLNYVVQSDVGGTNGKNYYAENDKHQSSRILINDSGNCIAYISFYRSGNQLKFYLSTFIPDYVNNTVVENTGYGDTDYAYLISNGYGVINAICYLDTENNIIEGVDPFCGLFKFDIDLTGTHPKIIGYTNTHPTPREVDTYSSVYPLILKNINSNVDCYVYFITSSSPYNKGYLYLNKYSGTDNTLYDSMTFSLVGSGLKTHYYQYDNTESFSSRYGYINYYIKNNEIYLLLPTNIVVKVDTTGTTPKLILSNTNGLNVNGEYPIRPSGIIYGYGYYYTYLHSDIDYSKILKIGSGSDSTTNTTNCRTNEVTQLREPCVLGQKFTDSQGNEFFTTIDFTLSSYESGAYRLMSNADVLTEDE